MTAAESLPSAERIPAPAGFTLRELLAYFLWLGSFGFGGPIAFVGYMQRDLVERRRWFSREDYSEGLALARLAPGRWPRSWRSISAGSRPGRSERRSSPGPSSCPSPGAARDRSGGRRRPPGEDVDRGGNVIEFFGLRDRPKARLIGALVVWLSAGSAAAEGVPAVRVLDFEDATVGSLPSGFQTALTGGGGPVAWSIQEDASSPAGPKVLMQMSRDETSKRFPLCVYERFSARDADLSVRFKPISGKIDQAAGLLFRYRDPENYYIVRANALEENVVLYKVEDGKRSDLKPVDAGLFAYGRKTAVPAQAWSTLRVVARGSRFSVHLDGNHLFDVEDATFPDAGRVGLWTKADSVTAFDDLTVVPAE